jgi:hypothetical protein
MMPAAGPAEPTGPSFGNVLAEAVVWHYGSVKAAAITLNVDPSLLMREFRAGTISRLDRVEIGEYRTPDGRRLGEWPFVRHYRGHP